MLPQIVFRRPRLVLLALGIFCFAAVGAAEGFPERAQWQQLCQGSQA